MVPKYWFAGQFVLSLLIFCAWLDPMPEAVRGSVGVLCWIFVMVMVLVLLAAEKLSTLAVAGVVSALFGVVIYAVCAAYTVGGIAWFTLISCALFALFATMYLNDTLELSYGSYGWSGYVRAPAAFAALLPAGAVFAACHQFFEFPAALAASIALLLFQVALVFVLPRGLPA